MHGYTILNGGDLDENGNSKEGKLVMRDQKNCTKTVLTKMAIKEGKPIMHGYITSHGGDLNEMTFFGQPNSIFLFENRHFSPNRPPHFSMRGDGRARSAENFIENGQPNSIFAFENRHFLSNLLLVYL